LSVGEKLPAEISPSIFASARRTAYCLSPDYQDGLMNASRAAQHDHNAADSAAHLLEQLYGPVIPSAVLWRALGFPSPDALRKAIARGTAPVQTFTLENRRGRFAYTRDVVLWLENELGRDRTTAATKEDLMKPP
jgi:hypothetical protein